MVRRTLVPIVVSVLLVSSLALGGAMVAAEDGAETETHTGTHVTFGVTGEAITYYTVQGSEVISSLKVQSASETEQDGQLGVDVALGTVTSLQAASVSVDSETDTAVEVSSDSGSSIEAHDNERGHLLVHAAEDDQVVLVNLSSDVEAEQESDSRVAISKRDGSDGTFILIGDGSVIVNEDGNVSAEVEQDSRLVYRHYDDGRDEADKRQERHIANGTAAAEVFVTTTGEGASNATADVVEYGSDTSVEVVTASENEIRMTAERTEADGRIIITQMSASVIEPTEGLQVTVDGSAATHVDSMHELRAAADNGEHSAFMVRQATAAGSNVEVLIGVNHFSEREILIQSSAAADGDDGTDGSDQPEDPLPGFGLAIAVAALLTAAALALRRRT